jgi:hypothetical protein
VICFEWLQRPENVVAGFLTWPDYRSKNWPHAVRIEHHKNKALVWHPLEETLDGETVKFYAEAEDVLSQLPKLGVPMIMRRIEKGERKGHAKVWSYPGMEKVVQQMRKKIDGVSELFALDACRHGGMTELEEAELTDGQGRALSGDRAGLSRLRQGNDDASISCDPETTCTSLDAEGARSAECRWSSITSG